MEIHIHIHHHGHSGGELEAKLDNLAEFTLNFKEDVMANLDAATVQLQTLKVTLQKAFDEINAKIQSLVDAANNQTTTPEFDAALTDVVDLGKALDDIVRDAPPVP